QVSSDRRAIRYQLRGPSAYTSSINVASVGVCPRRVTHSPAPAVCCSVNADCASTLLASYASRLHGQWWLENTHKGAIHFVMEQDGAPSLWNTLRALRVLGWWYGRTPSTSR